jgi:hypothetical protein
MEKPDSREISLLLANRGKGDEVALEQLMPLVYDALRRLAHGYMQRQPSGHTFQTTELIHEAYLKPWSADGKQLAVVRRTRISDAVLMSIEK